MTPILAAVAAPVVFAAYGVFGMTGFGSAMIAVPILVHVFPLQFAVPLIVLFDLVCTSLVGGSNWRKVSGAELLRIVPWMVLGIAAGAIVLPGLGARWPLICLGVFVLAESLRGLAASGPPTRPPINSYFALPFGLVGGAIGAVFGTGGPIYTIYLSRRLPNVEQFRATISVTVLLSGISRAVAFGIGGLYSGGAMLEAALTLFPFCLLGLFVGSRLRTRVAPQRLRRLILFLLAAAGIGAIARGIAS